MTDTRDEDQDARGKKALSLAILALVLAAGTWVAFFAWVFYQPNDVIQVGVWAVLVLAAGSYYSAFRCFQMSKGLRGWRGLCVFFAGSGVIVSVFPAGIAFIFMLVIVFGGGLSGD